jgi:hypothetical protein
MKSGGVGGGSYGSCDAGVGVGVSVGVSATTTSGWDSLARSGLGRVGLGCRLPKVDWGCEGPMSVGSRGANGDAVCCVAPRSVAAPAVCARESFVFSHLKVRVVARTAAATPAPTKNAVRFGDDPPIVWRRWAGRGDAAIRASSDIEPSEGVFCAERGFAPPRARVLRCCWLVCGAAAPERRVAFRLARARWNATRCEGERLGAFAEDVRDWARSCAAFWAIARWTARRCGSRGAAASSAAAASGADWLAGR